MNHFLYLASKSYSRALLLSQAKIPFVVWSQDANEGAIVREGSLENIVQNIARHKMNELCLPSREIVKVDHLFILTADTLSQELDGTICGKPCDLADARRMIVRARGGSYLSTAYVLRCYYWSDDRWIVKQTIERVVSVHYRFNIPDVWIDSYFNHSIGLQTANAIAVEEYGAQFLEVVNGSYSAIVGLPMYELRQDLDSLDFFTLRK